MLSSKSAGDVPVPIRAALAVVVGAALLAGLYGRFKGLGTWPLGVDEFYISRSIDHVLKFGVPRFPCGGYYTRGLIYQYLVAGVRLLGGSPEFSGRAVAAVCGLAVLPAAYLLGKRTFGSLAGWLAVIILGVSVWEIEMGRFARMYAPFQSVFAWYAVFYLRYTLDRRSAALGWMIGLSVLGVLTWEGGALMGIANILAVVTVHRPDQAKAADWGRLAGLIALLALLRLATMDLRGFADLPDAAADATPGTAGALAWFAPLEQHWGWTCVGLLALLPAAASVRWIASQRTRPLVALGLGAALVSAALHLFVTAAGILLLMLLLRWLLWPELAGRAARYYVITLFALLAFWTAFDVASAGGVRALRAGGDAVLRPIIRQLFGFPDLYDQIVRPWGRTVPILSVWLLAALAYLCFRTFAPREAPAGAARAGAAPSGSAAPSAPNATANSNSTSTSTSASASASASTTNSTSTSTSTSTSNSNSSAIAALLSLILVMGLSVGAVDTPRVETRYTFFLYPLLIVLAVTATLTWVGQRRPLRGASAALGAALPLLCFGATEDFQPRHIAQVDSESVNFRIGMSVDRAAHYYPRNDLRVIGEWLAAHTGPGDVVVTGIPNLDPYYDAFDYFYLDAADDRYEAYVCHDGRTERWSNHPVLYTVDSLAPLIASRRRVFVTVYPETAARLRAAARSRGWSVTRAWGTVRGNTDVLLIAQAGAAAD